MPLVAVSVTCGVTLWGPFDDTMRARWKCFSLRTLCVPTIFRSELWRHNTSYSYEFVNSLGRKHRIILIFKALANNCREFNIGCCRCRVILLVSQAAWHGERRRHFEPYPDIQKSSTKSNRWRRKTCTNLKGSILSVFSIITTQSRTYPSF